MRKTMDWALLIVMVFSLCVMPACGSLGQLAEIGKTVREVAPMLKETVANIKEVTKLGKESFEGASAEVKEAVAEFKDIHEEAMLKADKDKSGGLNGIGEWLTYLGIAGVGGSGYLARKLRQGSLDTKKEIDDLKAKVNGG
jgi:uncharacterized protein involved in high-affinity Fe2+ transport